MDQIGASRSWRPGTTRLDALLIALLAALTVASGVVWWNVLDRRDEAQASLPATSAGSSSSPSSSGSASVPPAGSPGRSTAPEDDLPRSAEPLGLRQIVWRHNVGPDWAMSTISSKGSRGTVVLASGEQEVAPLVSHDRRTVLYVRRERPGERSSLHAVAADGSVQRLLFRDGSASCPFLRQVVWSVDGTLGVVCKLEGAQPTYLLATARTDGTFLRTLDVGVIGGPTFSPDGRQLLYPKASSGSYKQGGALYVVDVDGSDEPTKVLGGRNVSPAWAPTGTTVAFSRLLDDDRARVVTASVDEEDPELEDVTPGDELDVDPSWSPDGKALVFRRQLDDEHSRLVVVDRDGDDERELSRSGMIGSPSWTPR